MARPQKTKKNGKPPTKRQETELTADVKQAVTSKIAQIEAEVTTIRRRSEMKDKLQSLAAWLKSEEPLSHIAKGKSQTDDPKNDSQKILKKAADNLLKNVGVRAKEEPEKVESLEGAPTAGEAEGASEGDGSQ